MNYIMMESYEKTNIKCITDDSDMCDAFDDGYIELIYNYSDSDIKTEYLNNLSWELQKKNKDTNLRFIYYRNVNMYQGRGPIPMHPGIFEIAFHDVTFHDYGSIHLEGCKNICVIYFINCIGTLRLDKLEIEAIVLGCENDRQCFELNESTVESVKIMSDTNENPDCRDYIEGHFIRALARYQDNKNNVEKNYDMPDMNLVGEEKRIQAEIDQIKAYNLEVSWMLVAKDTMLHQLQVEAEAKMKETQQLTSYNNSELTQKAQLAEALTAMVQKLGQQHNDVYVYVQQLQQQNNLEQLDFQSKDRVIQQLTAEKQYITTYNSAHTAQIRQMNDYINQLVVKIKTIKTNQSVYMALYKNEYMINKLKYEHAVAINQVQTSMATAYTAITQLQAYIAKHIREKQNNWGSGLYIAATCLKCGSNFCSADDLKLHQKNCKAKSLPAPVNYGLPHVGSQSQQFQQYEVQQYAQVTCPKCCIVLPNATALDSHVCGQSALTCYSCGITMSDYATYEAHMRIHK